MAGETGFSHTTIRRMWAAFGLQPHRSQTFKLSSDPLFVDKVRNIVGLYMSLPNRALVLSPHLYRVRNLIERVFNKIKQCRRVATRYDKLAANYLAFVKLAAIRIWLRSYESDLPTDSIRTNQEHCVPRSR